MFDHFFSYLSDGYSCLFMLAVSALLFAGYWFLMRKEKRHQMVRFYLLGSLVLALLVPFSPRIQVTATIEGTHASEWDEAEQMVYYDQSAEATQVQKTTPRAVIANKPIEEQKHDLGWVLTMIFWYQVLARVYLIGCGVMLFLLIGRLVSLGVRLRHLEYTRHDGYRLALTEGDRPAFSFFRTVVIGKSDFSEAEIGQLLGHELVHVRRRHTLDILFCELMKVVFWFNPFVWLTERELKRVHEYQADEQMMDGEDAATYAELLYHQLSGKCYSPIGNNFDYPITKKRIQMIRQRKNRWGGLSLLVVLPVMALMLFVNCDKKQLLEGTFRISKISLMHDDAEGTLLQCDDFFNLEDRTFDFHKNGTVEVRCTADSTVNFTGTYTINKSEGLRIYGPDRQLWIQMHQVTDFLNGDSISITFTDYNPINGLETMLNTLAINQRPTFKATHSEQHTDNSGIPIEVNPVEVTDTTYPSISIVSKDYNYMVSNTWFFTNRMLVASLPNRSPMICGLYSKSNEKGEPTEYFFSMWQYPEGKVCDEARINYDTISDKSINPKRDDYKFQLRVEMKRK